MVLMFEMLPKYRDSALKANRILDQRLIDLKKELTPQEFKARSEEIEYFRKQMNDLFKIPISR